MIVPDDFFRNQVGTKEKWSREGDELTCIHACAKNVGAETYFSC